MSDSAQVRERGGWGIIPINFGIKSYLRHRFEDSLLGNEAGKSERH